MDKFTEWVIDKFQNPPGLFFFLLGTLLILLGVTNGFELPLLKQLAPDANFRWVSLGIGFAFCLMGTVLYYRPPKIAGGTGYIPDELKQSFSARRASLSAAQENLLSHLEAATYLGEFESQDTIETAFNEFRSQELFYRLEYLRLLGFLEKQANGKDKEGRDRFAYRLSPLYKKELGPNWARSRPT